MTIQIDTKQNKNSLGGGIRDKWKKVLTKADVEALEKEVEATKKSVSDSKTTVAAAITQKGVATTATDTFATMVNNIQKIITLASGTADATAAAADMLTGKTAYVKGKKITGTMANKGAVNQALAINGTYTIPAGYHNGSGKITQSIPTQAAQTITPGTANKTIAAGRYLSGVQTIKGDANLKAANIKKGVSIFGVAGTLTGKDSLLEARLTDHFSKVTYSIPSWCFNDNIRVNKDVLYYHGQSNYGGKSERGIIINFPFSDGYLIAGIIECQSGFQSSSSGAFKHKEVFFSDEGYNYMRYIERLNQGEEIYMYRDEFNTRPLMGIDIYLSKNKIRLHLWDADNSAAWDYYFQINVLSLLYLV